MSTAGSYVLHSSATELCLWSAPAAVRAFVLGANDGLVSVASLMLGELLRAVGVCMLWMHSSWRSRHQAAVSSNVLLGPAAAAPAVVLQQDRHHR
jgi:hypothetical protein